MARIASVLFDGSYENYGHIYDLEDGKIVFYSAYKYMTPYWPTKSQDIYLPAIGTLVCYWTCIVHLSDVIFL